MMLIIRGVTLYLFVSGCLSVTLAQTPRVVSGIVVLHPPPHLRGLNMPVKNVLIRNRNNGRQTSPNSIGYFEIVAKIGDDLEASLKGFPTQTLLVTKYDNIVFDMDSTIRLQEVAVIGIKENEKSYKALRNSYSNNNSLHFEGRPPVGLLSPIGGSPATFFYELFSKEGKNARKLNAYIQADVEQQKILSHFTDDVIKRVIPGITEEDMKRYKELHTPDVKQLLKWSDYDLIDYIKTTYKAFRASSK